MIEADLEIEASFKKVNESEAEETLTIADILPADFPTSTDGAWRIDNDERRICYTTDNPDTGLTTFEITYNLGYTGGRYSFPVAEKVTETDGNYVYLEEDWWKVVFVMSDGELVQIDFDSYNHWPDPAIGTYIPPIPSEPHYNGADKQLQNNEDHCEDIENPDVEELIDEESEQAANDSDPDIEKESFVEIDYDGLNQEDIESMEMPENEAAEEIQTEFSELTLEELEQ